MQWLANLPLGDKPPLQLMAFVGIAIVAIVVLFFAYRAVFGHRLRFSGGGKARQPRLGLVDAFSLDGQRQLVIVRRDNVEHLLMIGGPNDVVVESQIVRGPASGRSARKRCGRRAGGPEAARGAKCGASACASARQSCAGRHCARSAGPDADRSGRRPGAPA